MQKNWKSIEHIFNSLNRSQVNYIVLRNYELLTSNEIFTKGHDDIDFLCDNIKEMVKILDAQPIYKFPYRNSYVICFQNNELQVDIRYVGDGYYDTKWEKQLLERKKLFNDYIFIIDDEMYFYSLIYHAIFQKNFLSKEYFNRLKKMAQLNGKNASNKKQLESLLFAFMDKNRFKFTFTKDPGIILNFKSAPSKMISINLYRILLRLLLRTLNKIFLLKGEK